MIFHANMAPSQRATDSARDQACKFSSGDAACARVTENLSKTMGFFYCVLLRPENCRLDLKGQIVFVSLLPHYGLGANRSRLNFLLQ